MPIFVIFIFGSVVFGAGAMLAPALSTHGPRIGLAGALTLAFVLSGSVFLAALAGWNTLLIDYLWFAALVGIFFAGTLSAGMFRAEAEGGTREYTGWPGPRELGLFTAAALIAAVPALVLPVPLGTEAQGMGYLALTLRDGGSLTSLAPFHPEITYLYAPGFPALVAYLGRQLPAGMQNIQLAVGAVLSLLFIWLAYDFGNEIDREGSRRTGIVFAICALIGTGLLTANLDGHYTAQLGLVFSLAFLIFAIRFYREGRRMDFVGAALTLAAVPLSQPEATLILLLGYVPWLGTLWLARPRPTLWRWLGLAVGIPLLALVGLLPWIVRIAPLLAEGGPKLPFAANAGNLLILVVYHGVVIVLLAAVGVILAARRRDAIDLLMIGWLALILDFTALGIVPSLLGTLLAPLLSYSDSSRVAWHGPLIVYICFAGGAVLWFMQRMSRPNRERLERSLRLASLPLINLMALAAVLIVAYIEPALALSKRMPLQIGGAYASHADVQAMQWLRQNTPASALILNHPGPHEGDWAPLVAQRNTVYFPRLPFFRDTCKAEAIQQDLRAFWRNPADPTNAALLARYGVTYVLVPQIVTHPASLEGMFRWRPPDPEAAAFRPVSEAAFLKRVFEQDGAQVYQVVSSSAAR